MRPIWLQLLVLTTAMVVSPLSLSALTDSWGFELPEEPQAQASQAAEPLPEEAEEASEWGGWGLKTASGDFFEEEPDYTGKGWPQTQQPRRENGDFAYDTASDVRNGPNVYTYVVQNPWTYFDPEGLSLFDETRIGVTGSFGFGTKSGPSFSMGLFLSGKTELGESAQVVSSLNFRYYGNEQGTRNDKSSSSYDLTASSQLIYGSGEGSALPLRTLNRKTESGFDNTFNESVAWGAMVNYNAATDDVTSHHIGAVRIGDLSFSYQNDQGDLPGLPFSFGIGTGSDQAWTASAIIDTPGLSGGYQQFTGVPKYEYLGGAGTIYPQDYGQEMLNRAEHFMTMPLKNGSITAGFTGPHSGQDVVHHLPWVDQPSFKKTAKDEVILDMEVE